MTRSKPDKETKDKVATREDRLKAALKANLARRKAQLRARGTGKSAITTDKG